ncbi:MAG TPA: hypothetical protein VF950_29830 [Planctomycetota bacterium]
MKLVKTDEARPGQKAARDVTDLRGNLLFRSGTELNAELLASCKQRNVSHLFVEDDGPSAAASPADLETRKAQIARDIDRQFAGVDGAPLMAALREAAKRHQYSALR